MGGSVVISFKVRRDLLALIDAVARMEGKTRSELIRDAIEMYLRATDAVEAFETRRIRIVDFTVRPSLRGR